MTTQSGLGRQSFRYSPGASGRNDLRAGFAITRQVLLQVVPPRVSLP